MMKLSLSVALAAISGVCADNYNNYNGANQNAQNQASGYYSYSGSGNSYNSGQVSQYDQQYYANYYDANYVQQSNSNNGNFQYYDADNSYNQSYSAAGYYDEYGSFQYYQDDSYYGNVDDYSASQYYNSWQQNGGADGYYDNYGNWISTYYENVPCLTYSQQYAANYYGEDGEENGDNYNAAWDNGYNNQGGDDEAWDEYIDGCADSLQIRTANCANSIVAVQNVTILCDSPYRGYFSRGTHVASELCEYGDHAVVMVFFEVLEDLDWMQQIYMTFGIYAGKQTKELLWAVRSVELCNTFVGHDCTRAGSYAFAFQVTFDYGILSDRALFVPLIEMGFSTRADEGYNLGGVNIYCKFNSMYQQYDPWYNGRHAHAAQVWGGGGLGKAGGQYGILIGVVLLGVAFALFTWTRRFRGIDFDGNDDDLVEVEKPAPLPSATDPQITKKPTLRERMRNLFSLRKRSQVGAQLVDSENVEPRELS